MAPDLEARFAEEKIRVVTVDERNLIYPTVSIPLEGELKDRLARVEEAIIDRELFKYRGSRENTAAALGINRTTLFNKMRVYNLLEKDYSSGLPPSLQ